jgi:hypothetical protein
VSVVDDLKKALGSKEFQPLKIFVINTASDDLLAADLITMLRKKKFLCWDSKKSILPGRIHNEEQEKALYEAHIVLGLLTKSTPFTAGRYTALLKLSQDAQLEMPGGVIKFIPLLMDGCDLPYAFQKYQPLDMTAAGAAQKLVASLRRRSDTVVINDQKKPEAIWL